MKLRKTKQQRKSKDSKVGSQRKSTKLMSVNQTNQETKGRGRVKRRRTAKYRNERRDATATLRNEKGYRGIMNNCMSMHQVKQMEETNHQKDTNYEPDSSRCRKCEYAPSNQIGSQTYFHKGKSRHRWLHWIILSNILKN